MTTPEKGDPKRPEKSDTNVNVIDVDPVTLTVVVVALLFIPLVISGFMSH